MTDRHKNPPQSIRLPEDLHTWYKTYATSQNHALHTVLIEALQQFRRQTEQGWGTRTIPQSGTTTTTSGPTPKPKTTSTRRTAAIQPCTTPNGQHPPINRTGAMCTRCNQPWR
jgi:hypothetical protein